MILVKQYILSTTGTSSANRHYQQVKKAYVPVDGADARHTFLVAHLL